MNDFVESIASGTISAILGALFVAALPLGNKMGFTHEPPSSGKQVKAKNKDGQQAVVTDNSGTVDIDQTQNHTTIQRIQYNIRHSVGYTSGGQPGMSNGMLALVIVLLLVAAAAFGRFFIPVLGGMVGAALMLTVVTIRFLVSDRRHAKSPQTAYVVVELCLSIIATVLLGYFIFQFSWDGKTMVDVANALHDVTVVPSINDGVLPWILSFTIEPPAELFIRDPQLLVMALLALVGLTMTLLLDVSAALSLVGWDAYSRMSQSLSRFSWVTKAAQSFETTTWKSVLVLLVVFALEMGFLFGFPSVLDGSFIEVVLGPAASAVR
ncbi:hypothetical protein [Brevibacterium moorei]|uniref:hypothetical protein n=1 Tax=Brevibacterium moorei TaxID=2968457 RepID=UPI00211BFCC9|nr:hypothetical protein [Brevibacterium sp. 68QC2CO]MCQ9385419.1 hypothetical protein [Brevibacterium sp. 68QC2CO]